MERGSRWSMSVAGCSDCLCRSCLLWWSGRCPFGECYDEHRAKINPYDTAHPNMPPRKLWSNWNKPGEQAHWCRGGTFYPTNSCEHYIIYQEEKTICKSCLESNVTVFQDGYINCSILDSIGCQECYRRFEQSQT